jgi:hypothetical protein
MTMRMRILLSALLATCVASIAPTTSVRAEDPPAAEKKRNKRARNKASRKKEVREAAPAREPVAKSAAPAPASAPPRREHEASNKSAQDAARAVAQEAAQGVDAQIVKEGDTSVKVMSFTGLDIEGRLKSPQLLYFVNRVHAEFERPKLPHRSFMPELERSTQRDPLR